MKIFFRILIIFLFLSAGLLTGEVSLSRIKERVEKTGKLKFKENVEVNYLDRNSFNNYINSWFEKEYAGEQFEKDELFLKIMGFISDNISLKKLKKRLIINNAGGFYDEKSKVLYALKEHGLVDPVYSLIVVHELRHAIQDQHFGLSNIIGRLSDLDDRKIAALAAIEGDAMLILSLYAQKFTPFPVPPELSSSKYNSDALLTFSPIKFSYNLGNIPDVLKYQLTMPYVKGLKFVFHILKKKKWKGVNSILKYPPDSSEQILHPEKYLKREKPVKIEIRFIPENYDLYSQGAIGEFFLNVMMMKNGNYTDIAKGWGGDKFRLYKNEQNYFLMWESAWDKEEYCSDFFYNFKRYLERKFEVSFKKGNVKGNPFYAGRSDNDYVFIRKLKEKMFFTKTNDRIEINKFINGGYYD
ncbi:MAG: hypothetical protein ABFR75_13635 [Acidobacteriota bacterium]